MNRSTRIILLLVIDVCFFFVELIVGAQPQKMHSGASLTVLQDMRSARWRSSRIPFICSSTRFAPARPPALTSFPSDVLSLVVALYAIKVGYVVIMVLLADRSFLSPPVVLRQRERLAIFIRVASC